MGYFCGLQAFLFAIPCHNEGDGEKHQHDAQGNAGGEAFMEDQHTDEKGSDGLQGSQDGGMGGADMMDAHCHENQGNDGGEQGQSEGTSPLQVAGRKLQVNASSQPDNIDEKTEQQGIERQFQGGECLQERPVHVCL